MTTSTPATTTGATDPASAHLLAIALEQYRDQQRKTLAPIGSPASTEPFGAFAVEFLATRGYSVRRAPKPVAGIDPARFVDQVHAAWSGMGSTPVAGVGRPTFGAYLVERLERAGYVLRPACLEEVLAEAAPPPAEPAQPRPDDLYPLNVPVPDLPHWNIAVGMSVGEVADLLAALDEAGLRWTPGVGDRAGTLDTGPAEPGDLHVVFDEHRAAWQRDDDEAGPDPARWFSTAGGESSTWTTLWQRRGPLTPDGGIAPPARVGAEPRR